MGIKIALLQNEIVDGGPEANIAQAVSMLQKIMEDIDVICLPELFSTGLNYQMFHHIADSLDGPLLDPIRSIAKQLGCWIVCGSIPEAVGDKLYNTVPIIDAQGNIAGYYRKTHLQPMTGEDRLFTQGNDIPVFQLPIGKIGVLISTELSHPEVARTLCLKGADMVFVPAQFCKSKGEQWKLLIRSRALENHLFVALANRVGEDLVGKFSGHSSIIDPVGGTVTQAGDRPGIYIGELDLEEYRKVRAQNICIHNRRTDLYGNLEPQPVISGQAHDRGPSGSQDRRLVHEDNRTLPAYT